MVWKIWFWIYLALLCISYIVGSIISPDISSVDSKQFVVGLLGLLLSAVTLSYFYALGWKKKLFSKKLSTVANIFIIFMVFAFTVFSSVISVLLLQKDPITATYPAIFITAAVFAIFMTFISYNIGFLPIYFAMFKYKKQYESFTEVKKPCWKIFTAIVIYSVLTLFARFFIFKFSDITGYNIWDYIRLPFCIIMSLALIGLSWDKKFFNQIFWKIIAISYIPTNILLAIYGSSLFKSNFGTNSISQIIFHIGMIIVYTYMAFKYAFSKEIFTEDRTFENEITE